jgi:hypothetical protein
MYSVNNVLSDKVLLTAFAVSLLLHAGVLAIRFVDPEFLRVRSTDPSLEIILVNAKSPARPSAAEALAKLAAARRLPDARRRHGGDRAPHGRAA